jgi:hypothetical protein
MNFNPRHALVLGLLALFSLGLMACGGGGDSSSSSDETDEITKVITVTVEKPSPEDCTERETQAFVEQTTSEKGAKAVKSCEEESTSPAESAKVSKVEVNGDEATAAVAFTGGQYGGQVIDVSLVKEDDKWKLDEIVKVAKLDREALLKGLEEAFADPSTGIPAEAAECINEKLGEASNEEFENLIIEGEAPAIQETIEACAS